MPVGLSETFGAVDFMVVIPSIPKKLKSMFASMSGSKGPVGADISCGGNTGIGNATFTISPGSNAERPLPSRNGGRMGVKLPGFEFATLLLTLDPIGLTQASI